MTHNINYSLQLYKHLNYSLIRIRPIYSVIMVRLPLSSVIKSFLIHLRYLMKRTLLIAWLTCYKNLCTMIIYAYRTLIIKWAVTISLQYYIDLKYIIIPFNRMLSIYNSLKATTILEKTFEDYVIQIIAQIRARYILLTEHYRFINISLTLDNAHLTNSYLKKKTYRILFDFYYNAKNLKFMLYDRKKINIFTYRLTNLNDNFDQLLIQSLFYDTFNFIEKYKNQIFFDDIDIVKIYFNVRNK